MTREWVFALKVLSKAWLLAKNKSTTCQKHKDTFKYCAGNINAPFYYFQQFRPVLLKLFSKKSNFNSMENPKAKKSRISGKMTKIFSKISTHKFPDLVSKVQFLKPKVH